MSVINSGITINSVLSYFPTLESVDTEALTKYIKEAYWYCVNKIRLLPVVTTLYFEEEGYCNLLNQVFVKTSDINEDEIMFKEVLTVHCDNYSDTPFGLKEIVPMQTTVSSPTGTAYHDGEVLHGSGYINIVGYAYPWLTSKRTYTLDNWEEIGTAYCSPRLLYPVFAMMYSLYCKDNMLINRAGMYEALAIKYINIYNDNLYEPKISNLTQTIKAGAYEL